jgi:hypothetical protein
MVVGLGEVELLLALGRVREQAAAEEGRQKAWAPCKRAYGDACAWDVPRA